MPKVMDIDVATGEVTERDMTADELADYEARQNAEVSADQE
jgi:hypothetical protein